MKGLDGGALIVDQRVPAEDTVRHTRTAKHADVRVCVCVCEGRGKVRQRGVDRGVESSRGEIGGGRGGVKTLENAMGAQQVPTGEGDAAHGRREHALHVDRVRRRVDGGTTTTVGGIGGLEGAADGVQEGGVVGGGVDAGAGEDAHGLPEVPVGRRELELAHVERGELTWFERDLDRGRRRLAESARYFHACQVGGSRCQVCVCVRMGMGMREQGADTVGKQQRGWLVGTSATGSRSSSSYHQYHRMK